MKETLKNLTDEELLIVIREGNQRYFAILADRYEKYVIQKCKSYVKDPDVAADLTQEVMIKLFLQLPTFRKEAKFSTWLFTIIHHTCMDYLRRRKKSEHEMITEKLAEEVSDMVDFEDELPGEKTVEVLEQLLEEMDPDEKVILLLKYQERHSIKDIQLTMNLSESAIKMRLKRAKDKLNKLYGEKLKNVR